MGSAGYRETRWTKEAKGAEVAETPQKRVNKKAKANVDAGKWHQSNLDVSAQLLHVRYLLYAA